MIVYILSVILAFITGVILSDKIKELLRRL